ncbi:MAG: hypothetical protein WCP55_23125, partial [Lentisphaerota bacterium]
MEFHGGGTNDNAVTFLKELRLMFPKSGAIHECTVGRAQIGNHERIAFGIYNGMAAAGIRIRQADGVFSSPAKKSLSRQSEDLSDIL